MKRHNPYNIEDVMNKKELAESKGYNYIVVYSDEVKTVDKRGQKIIQLREIINGNCKEN